MLLDTLVTQIKYAFESADFITAMSYAVALVREQEEVRQTMYGLSCRVEPYDPGQSLYTPKDYKHLVITAGENLSVFKGTSVTGFGPECFKVFVSVPIPAHYQDAAKVLIHGTEASRLWQKDCHGWNGNGTHLEFPLPSTDCCEFIHVDFGKMVRIESSPYLYLGEEEAGSDNPSLIWGKYSDYIFAATYSGNPDRPLGTIVWAQYHCEEYQNSDGEWEDEILRQWGNFPLVIDGKAVFPAMADA